MIEEMGVTVGFVDMTAIFRIDLDFESGEVHHVEIISLFVGDRSPVLFDELLWASVEQYIRDQYEYS
jgi:hypothetical protein